MQVSRLSLLLFSSTEYQKEIARTCRMPPSRLTEYRLGRKAIPTHHLLVLCGYFQVPPHELLGVVEVPEVAILTP